VRRGDRPVQSVPPLGAAVPARQWASKAAFCCERGARRAESKLYDGSGAFDHEAASEVEAGRQLWWDEARAERVAESIAGRTPCKNLVALLTDDHPPVLP
jgi:hypothetical protein